MTLHFMTMTLHLRYDNFLTIAKFMVLVALGAVMAEEIRYHNWNQSESDTGQADQSFTNTAAEVMHIRSLDGYVQQLAAAAAMNVEVSKSPVTITNGETSFRWNFGAAGAQGATKRSQFPRGQITLEPGETLYLNLVATGTPTSNIQIVTIGYHY